MSAEQMRRDGIKRIPKWTKGRKIGCATYRWPIPARQCGHASCGKRAGYTTPGN